MRPIKRSPAVSESAEFYIPTELEWEYAKSPDFKRDNARKATIKFPGTKHVNLNMSRFTQLSSGANTKEYPAYILLTNSKLSDGTNIPSFLDGTSDGDNHYAVIPIGRPGHQGGLSSEEPAFASVPEILGFVAELPSDGGESRIISNIPKASLEGSPIPGKIEGMSIDSIVSGKNQVLSIVAADALDRLAIIFRGNKVPRMEKMHQASIGTKDLDDECVSVEYAGNNIIVANYKNITGIKSEGWTDIVVEKTDKLFNCSYDSTLYNKVTLDIDPSEDGLVDQDGKLLKETIALNSEFENLTISKVIDEEFVDSQSEAYRLGKLSAPHGWNRSRQKNLSTVIFPGGNGKFSPLPLLKDLSYDPTEKKAADIYTYFQFSNPVKVKPTLDLIFGESITDIEGNLKVYGCSLTDAPIDTARLMWQWACWIWRTRLRRQKKKLTRYSKI